MAMNYVFIFFVAIFFGTECRSIFSSSLNQAVEVSEKHEASKANILPHISATANVNDVANMRNLSREFVDWISECFPEELKQFIATEGLTTEKFLSEFIAKAVNDTNQEDTAVQWLKVLKFILDDLASDVPNEKSIINEVWEKRWKEIMNLDFGEKESTSHEAHKNFILIAGNNWLEDLQEILDEQYVDTESSEDNESSESTSMDSSTLYSLIDHSSEEPEDGSFDGFDSEESDHVEADLQNDITGTQQPFEKLCRKHRTAN